MKKHSSAAGSTGLDRIRSLLAFRHHNPVARLVSTILAIAMATLLVAGAGAAYAGGADPSAPTDATTATPDSTTPGSTTPDSSTAGSTTPDATTPDATAPVSDPATTGSIDPTSTVPSPSKKTSTNALSAPTVVAATSNCNATVSPVIPTTSTGNFEIDGNLPKDGVSTLDWTGVANWPAAYGAPLVTNDGFADNGFTNGAKEFDNPATWTLGNAPNGKSDIGTVRTWTQVSGGDVLSYFAFDRADCTGSVAYDLEYNQAPNDTVVQAGGTLSYPHRTPGDLLFQFDQGGNGALTVSHSFVWTVQDPTTPANELLGCTLVAGYNPAGGWCPVTLDAGAFFSSASPDRLFVEGMLDLSKVNFPGNGCLNHFGTLNLRSHTSESDTSALQDSVAASISTPPGCGQLTIDKFLAGSTTKLPGATFVVSPNPATGAAGSSVVVTDNQTTPDPVPAAALPAGITNPTPVADPLPTRTVDGVIKFTEVEPGHTYTVYEVLPPDGGYLLPALADRSQSVVINAASGNTAATSAVLSFYDPQSWTALTATKTARGDYDTSFTWTITKGVRTGNDAFAASASKDSANLSESFDWQVTVGEGTRTESNHAVTGAITISNPNSSAVVATITESLAGCTYYDPADTDPPLTALADLDLAAAGFQVSVPADGNAAGTAYQYKCLQSDKTATSNTATISVDRSDYPRSQGDVGTAGTYDAAVTAGAGNTLSPSITWNEHNTDGTRTIHVTDLVAGATHAGSGAPWTHTWGDAPSTYVHTYASPVTATAGHCASVTDTATITETGQSASATATHCAGQDLSVTKNALGKITRSYLWKLDKRPCPPAILADICGLVPTTYTVGADGTVTVPYTVEATPDGSTEIGWVMTGDIVVTNPNTWEDVTLTSVTDVFPGASGCTVDTASGLIVPKSGSQTYAYTCTFTDPPNKLGTNTATATWSAAANTPTLTGSGTHTLTAAEWTVDDTQAVNKTLTVYDDKTDPANPVALGTATWNEAGDSTSYTYNLTIPGVAGKCVPVTNTAYLAATPGGTHVAQDSVTVTVCAPNGATLSKTAAGTFDRTYHWKLSKQVKNADGEWVDHATTAVQGYTAPFDYRVVLTQDGYDDDHWKITGVITVSNTNDVSVPDPISTTLTDTPAVGGTLTGCTNTDADSPLNGTVVTVASNTSKTVNYECTFSAKPSYAGGSNTVSGTNATPGSHDVAFSVDKLIDDQATVYDNKVSSTANGGKGEILGTATFDETDPGKSTTWTYTNTGLTAVAHGCEPAGNTFVNTAKVFGDDSVGTVAPDAQATATICPLWHALTAEKTATGHYDIGWSVLKQVRANAGDAWSSSATGTGSSTSHDFLYQVKVTQQDATNYRVTGAVTVHNPNDAAVVATLTEAPGVAGADCTFAANQGVGANGAITVAPDDDPNTQAVEDAGTSYTYTCTFTTAPPGGPGATGTNTAHLTWSRTSYPQTQGDIDGTNGTDAFALNPSDGYTFTAAAGQPTSLTVKDIATVGGNPVAHTFTAGETGNVGTIDNGNWVLTWAPGGGPYTATYSRTITGTTGECTAEGANPNTATIYATGDTTSLGSSTANARLCVEDVLGVVVDTHESLTRTFAWDIDKSTTTPSLTNTTGSVNAHYNVIVTALPSQDSAWEMHGTVTVTNPNTFTTKTVSSLDVAFNRGGTCVVDDALPVVPEKVGGVDGSAVVDFHCTFASAPAELFGVVTATVKWDAGASTADDTADVSTADWLTDPGTTLVNQFVKVYDDHAVAGAKDPLFGGTQLKWDDVFATAGDPGHQVTVGYDHAYSGAVMPAAGACANVVNTAWLVGDDAEAVLDSDTATVRVCTPAVVVSPPQVIVSPPQQHHPHVLPNTGGPSVWLFTTGLALLLAGGALVLTDQRRRRRS